MQVAAAAGIVLIMVTLHGNYQKGFQLLTSFVVHAMIILA